MRGGMGRIGMEERTVGQCEVLDGIGEWLGVELGEWVVERLGRENWRGRDWMGRLGGGD